MKFAISLMLFTQMTSAAPINLFYEENSEVFEFVKNSLVNNYQIPEGLMRSQLVSACDELLKHQGRLDLCVKKNGDLLIVSVDRRFINESLTIFSAP